MRLKYIITIMLFSFGNYCTAQVTVEKGKYYRVPELKEIVGKWAGTSDGSDRLIIEIKSVKEFLKGPDIYTDRLQGKYTYYRNGVIVGESREDALSAGSILQKSPVVVLSFYFSDKSKEKLGDLTLELGSFQSPTAKWKLKNKEGLVVLNEDGKTVDGRTWDKSFSVPTEMELKRMQ